MRKLPALVRGVTEAVCQAGFELGEPVQALRSRVRHADRTAQTISSYQREQFGDVIVVGAPVAEGEQPIPNVALAWRAKLTRAAGFPDCGAAHITFMKARCRGYLLRRMVCDTFPRMLLVIVQVRPSSS
jgi:hypothetical protein